MNHCDRCKQVVVWAKTPDGRHIPLDPMPHPKGDIAVLDPPPGVQIEHISPKSLLVAPYTTRQIERLVEPGQPLYRSHHQTCPYGSRRARR